MGKNISLDMCFVLYIVLYSSVEHLCIVTYCLSRYGSIRENHILVSNEYLQIKCVKISLVVHSVVDRGTGGVKLRTPKLVYEACPLYMQIEE